MLQLILRAFDNKFSNHSQPLLVSKIKYSSSSSLLSSMRVGSPRSKDSSDRDAGSGGGGKFSLRTLTQLVFAVLSTFWILAIIKVFALDDRRSLLEISGALVKFDNGVKSAEADLVKRSLGGGGGANIKIRAAKSGQASIDYRSGAKAAGVIGDGGNGGNVVLGGRGGLAPVPRVSEWLYIRSLEDSGFKNSLKASNLDATNNNNNNDQKKNANIIISSSNNNNNNYKNNNNNKHDPVVLSVGNKNLQPAISQPKSNPVFKTNPVAPEDRKPAEEFKKMPWELSWPPVLEDSTVPEEDGVEYLPLLDLPAPRFWAPENEDDLYRPRRGIINGQETIFLMLASYRDFQCRETITSAFMRADHPERLFVAAVDQVVPGDIGCLDLDIPCEKDPSQFICKYRSQISVYRMDAQYATGPVEARHIGDRMYRGEQYSMQLDAHCLFVRHWDTSIIKQFKATKNDMAVLSTYLTDVQGSIDKNGDSTRNTRPIMCNSDFEGMMPARYLRHGSQPEDVPVIEGQPQLQPFWAAGFSFSRGHFTVKVPYDAFQPMVFQGEEIAIGIRGFTHGYDFYAPFESVVFHEYAERSNRRTKVHMFWENSQKHAGDGIRSLKRATAIIGMARDIDPKSWDHSESDHYGLGSVRELDLFYKLFLIDPIARKATQLCPFVKSGQMHNEFTPYLRSDGKGIDYSKVTEYDTKGQIDSALKKQIPEVERMLSRALESKSQQDLDYGLFLADRCGFKAAHPDLYKRAKDMFEMMKEGKK